MIYSARIYNEFGELIRELSPKYLSRSYWDRFMDEEKRRNKRSLLFGARTQLQRHVHLENMCDEFMTNEGE